MEEYILETLKERYNEKIKFEVEVILFRHYKIKVQIENNVEKIFIFKWDYNKKNNVNLYDIFKNVEEFIIGYFLRSE